MNVTEKFIQCKCGKIMVPEVCDSQQGSDIFNVLLEL